MSAKAVCLRLTAAGDLAQVSWRMWWDVCAWQGWLRKHVRLWSGTSGCKTMAGSFSGPSCGMTVPGIHLVGRRCLARMSAQAFHTLIRLQHLAGSFLGPSFLSGPSLLSRSPDAPGDRQAKAALQVAVQCYERAALLALLWNVYTETMDARLKQRDMEIQVGCHSHPGGLPFSSRGAATLIQVGCHSPLCC